MSEVKKITLNPLSEGTAIDHLNPGTAVRVLEVLGIEGFRISAGMNVESHKMGKKDLIFIDGKKLSEAEINKIAIVGRGATINIIEASKVVKKVKITIPSQVSGIIKCINPMCVTNKENVATNFSIKPHHLTAKCFYCETTMNEREIVNSIV